MVIGISSKRRRSRPFSDTYIAATYIFSQ